MSNVLLFSGSNSSASINTQFIEYTATILDGHNSEVIDLRDFEPPMYGQDLEKESGLPDEMNRLLSKMDWADVVIISTPEHNGMPPAFLKNILDWLSRAKMLNEMEQQYLEGKKAVIMSVSPGGGGGVKGREQVAKLIGYAKAEIIGQFSLPAFSENFKNGKLENEELDSELNSILANL